MHDFSDPDFHQAYVNSSWTMLAALAWRKYLAVDRGVVYIHSFYAFPHTKNVAAQIEYIALEHLTSADVRVLVESYDPVREFVALIADASGLGMPYKFRASISQLPPPQAFDKEEAQKKSTNGHE